jgi:porphobilinogen synthase
MTSRPRALRATSAIRELVAEITLEPRHLIMPIFVRESLTTPREIEGMPGIYQHSLVSLPEHLERIMAAGIKAVMVFGIPDHRDELGSEATNPNGILHQSVAAIKEHCQDRLVVMADVCLDEFTSHGHCGLVGQDDRVMNDPTLNIYQKMSVQLAQAGADVVALSGMMDNQVTAVRSALESAGLRETLILGYSAKYASGFYAPFRNAVESMLTSDRKSYQQDYRNAKEATREIELDLEQGADFVMIKPALAYLDIVAKAAEISSVSVVAYMVSGEYAMLQAGFAAGVVPKESLILETHFSIRRAGADLICSYFALELAESLSKK